MPRRERSALLTGLSPLQALSDSIRLATWLGKAAISSALPSYEREMIVTTSAKVAPSPPAASCVLTPARVHAHR
jgi:hypothetical protein